VARNDFNVTETPTLQIHTNDARQYLRRSTNLYDVILMDAYSTTRYGSSLPPQLTTKEFFTTANEHLTPNGVLAYNVIGQIYGYRANLIGALYRTMKEVFPQVYFFPAEESQNVVFVATKSKDLYTLSRVMRDGQERMRSGLVKMPTFPVRMGQFLNTPPPSATNSVVLTDDFSPIESLMESAEPKTP
jgi:spermidine synthase